MRYIQADIFLAGAVVGRGRARGREIPCGVYIKMKKDVFLMSGYLDCIARSAPKSVCLVITENSSVFSSVGRPLCDLLREMRGVYGPDFEYSLVVYERIVENESSWYEEVSVHQ